METRYAPRVRLDLKVLSRVSDEDGQKFLLSKGNTFEIEIADISTLGVGIISRFFLPKGLRIELEIDGKPFGLDNSMKIKGEVRYCNYIKSSRYRCGIKFIDISSQYLNKIKDFIATYEKREEPRLKLSE
jgi:hypothetical protein